jgi:hypothetical protein
MMLFEKSNEELTLSEVSDFIENPCKGCNEECETCKLGVAKVIFVLNVNPAAIMDIIANHPIIPATYQLDSLADKMRKQNCLDKLGLLADKCLAKLVDSCVWNIYDLERCIKSMPSHSDKIMTHIVADESYMKRILGASDDHDETLKKINDMFPKYRDKFVECYNQYFKITSIQARR